MTAREEILAPPGALLVWGSLALALFLNLLPWPTAVQEALPDFLLVLLLYWCVQSPGRVGMGVSWLSGLTMDVANGNILGQHALAYGVGAFMVTVLARRLLVFSGWQQALHILPALLVAQLVVMTVRALITDVHISPSSLLPPLTGSLIWWPLALLLEWPRRARHPGSP